MEINRVVQVERRFWTLYHCNISHVKFNHRYGRSIVASMRLLKMKYYTTFCSFIVKIFYQNSESFAATAKLRSIWCILNGQNEATVRRLIKPFWGSVINVKRVRRGRSNENITAMRDNVAESPTTSIRHRNSFYRSTMQRNLTKLDVEDMWFQ